MSEQQGYDDEMLPDQTSDDTDRGWDDDRPDQGSEEDAEMARLLREKPPHW